MTPAQWWLTVTTLAAVAATLAGLVHRGEWRRSLALTLYLATVIVWDLGITAFPDTVYRRGPWIVFHAAFDLLKLAIAGEIAARIVATFPGAARGARLATAVFLLVGVGVALRNGSGFYMDLPRWHVPIITVTAWGFAVCALLVARYHLPADRLHRVVLWTFTPYLVVFGLLTSTVQLGNERLRELWGVADTLVYLAMCGTWAVAAWLRPVRAPSLGELVREARA